MDNVAYHVYGIGRGEHDVCYVGWTTQPISENRKQILSELATGSNLGVVRWLGQALEQGNIDLFEIESFSTIDEAKNSASYWCDCFCWLGLGDVAFAS